MKVRPVRVAASTVFGAVLVAVIANATALQKGRHPAPLFPSRRGEQAVANRPVPMPGAKRATLEKDDPGRDDVVASVARSNGVEPLVGSDPDPLGTLLKADAQPGAKPVPTRMPAASVLAAQRALAKLGYAVKADGQMSAATRHAVEAFARAHHLPPADGLTPKVLHELAAAAGSRSG